MANLWAKIKGNKERLARLASQYPIHSGHDQTKREKGAAVKMEAVFKELAAEKFTLHITEFERSGRAFRLDKALRAEALASLTKMKGMREGELVQVTQSCYLHKWNGEGKYNQLNIYNPLAIDEDWFIPVRGPGHAAEAEGNSHYVLLDKDSWVMWLGWQEAKNLSDGSSLGQWPVWLVGQKKAVKLLVGSEQTVFKKEDKWQLPVEKRK